MSERRGKAHLVSLKWNKNTVLEDIPPAHWQAISSKRSLLLHSPLPTTAFPHLLDCMCSGLSFPIGVIEGRIVVITNLCMSARRVTVIHSITLYEKQR